MICYNCKKEFEDFEISFNTEMCYNCSVSYFDALKNNALSGDKNSSIYIGKYDYMFTKEKQHCFRNITTRAYLKTPANSNLNY
jgi:hypothetical protein